MAENAGDNRKTGEDEPARLDQSTGKSSSEGEPARLNQDMIEAGSSSAEYAGTKWRRFEVEQATRNQDMIKLEAESTYDVFLSSALQCSGFANMLYNRLTADGYRVFKDDGNPDTSKEIPQLVDKFKIYVPIFSKLYAGRYQCLDALALMVEHTFTSGGKKEILPVFHNKEWSDEKLEITSLYRDALYAQRHWGAKKVEHWKKALVEAGKIRRLKLSSYEGEEALITVIRAEIMFRLLMEHNHVFEGLSTGENPLLSNRTSELEESRESKIIELLELEVNDVRIVGIHGRDSVGKTALAKIVYDQISLRFEACSFLAEIEETRRQPGGLLYLQTKLIFDILKREYEVASAFKGVRFLKEIFRNIKVLIVLDDVENGSLLKEFVGAKLDWFGSGSRIIVTSKESRVLKGFVDRGLAHTYDFNPMDYNLAFRIFWKYAPEKTDDLPSYVKIAIKILRAAKGLPLLLNVFGSFLHGKGLEEWMNFEELIQQFQEDYQKILSIIYDALDQKQKQMYLDIACFPPNVDCRIASYMWHWCDCPNDVIEVLRRRYLIKTEENKIGMHSMLRCLARKIIREGFSDPGTGVGFYVPAIAQETNKGKKGAVPLNSEEAGYQILPNTAFLSLGRANIGGQFADALSNVRWLHWQGCRPDAISIHLEKNENLVILDLSWSKVTESWGGWKRIKMERLKVLNLTGCADLLVTPSFSCCPNLEILILERCSRLVHIDPSINDLKLLVTLNLKFCTELSMLPVEMGGMHALKELLIDGTSVRELPQSISNLVLLQILSATNCFSLVRVLHSVRELKSISVLALEDAKILELPDSFGGLSKLTRLSLRNCRELRKLPESIGALESLVELDISGTGISKLPDSTICLWNLKVLKMDSCFLREFPLEVRKMASRVLKMDYSFLGKISFYILVQLRRGRGLIQLEEVHASWCRSLEGVIPDDIGELHSLRELRLRGTRISGLPSNLQSMSKLQTLDLLHCDILKELPSVPPPNLSNLDVNEDLKQKTLASSKFEGWRRYWNKYLC